MYEDLLISIRSIHIWVANDLQWNNVNNLFKYPKGLIPTHEGQIRSIRVSLKSAASLASLENLRLSTQREIHTVKTRGRCTISVSAYALRNLQLWTRGVGGMK
jgi:hypothetical protein